MRTRCAERASRTSKPASRGKSTLSTGSIDSTSGPTAATIACRVCAPSLIGTISPLAVSESSSGSTTIQSSSGSSVTSVVVSFSSMLQSLEPAGLDDAVEELARPRLLGRTEDSLRRPLLQNPACVEEDDTVGDVAGEPHLVCGDQHRHPALRELTDHAEHLGDELGIQSARDLVEQHHLGLHRERPHDRHALLLPAREPVGVVATLVGEAEASQERGRIRLCLPAREAERLARPEG